ncbi:MAG TPA: hypothetical protein VLE96_01450 [Chlamydiales bacterium]|nr:hypothetical protein [Chlamydiales bacterium]
MRKIILCIVPLCLCLLIAVSYLPSVIGIIAQAYFRHLGWEVSYKTIVWKDKSLVITELDVKNSSISFHVPVTEILVLKQHINLSKPTLRMSQIPSFSGSSNWTFAIEEGRFEKEDLPTAYFSLKKDQVIHAHISLENGWLNVEKGDKMILQAHQFPLSHINLEGFIDGTCQIHEEEIEWECTYQNMHCFGKGMMNQAMEAELRYENAAIFVRCLDSVWDITADDVPATFANTILQIAERLGYSSFSVEEGVFSGSVQFNSGFVKILQAHANHIHLRKDRFGISCEELQVIDEKYTVTSGSIFLDGNSMGVHWEGKGDLSGFGVISGQWNGTCFETEYAGHLNKFGVLVRCEENFKGFFEIENSDEGWNFSLLNGKTKYFEDFQLNGEIRDKEITCYEIKGNLDFGKKVAFYCPIVQTEGRFDIRFVHPQFDIIRLTGVCHKGDVAFDLSRSHFIGMPMKKGNASISLQNLETAFEFPWKIISFFTDIPKIYPDDEIISCQLSIQKDIDRKSLKNREMEDEAGFTGMRAFSLFSKDSLDDFAIKLQIQSFLLMQETTIPFALDLNGYGPKWQLTSKIWGGDVEGNILIEPEGILITKGKAHIEKGIHGEFSGKIASFDQGELNLSNLEIELGLLRSELQGELKGEGILHWKEHLEADFDLTAKKFKVNEWTLENEGSLHIFCSSKMGIVIQGLNVTFEDANCKIGLLQYKFCDQQPIFSLTQSQFYLPTQLLSKCGLQNFAAMQGMADVTFSSDLSKVSISMKEALIPYEDEQFCIRNLHATMNRNDGMVNFDLDHHSRLIPIDLAFQLDQDIKGRLLIENGLKVDWTYQNRFSVQSIEGKCSGVEASFHLDGDSLIGSAQVNGNEIRQVLPEKIAQVIDELKLGNGYELMGRLNFKNGLGFKGILSGKQIELFGFELRNLLSQIEWDKDYLLISDLKISDFAGVLKVEKISAFGVGKDPWTLSIPHILITELRPSLLQEIGGPPGTLSPLVVREIRIDDFQGFVHDRRTYTAKGELFFINSYKRENSILELPSDILSRIVGLDVELLTPVCGTLKYELHDGFFHFTELSGSYSENKRSEFFLVFNEDSPKMDLDWNLNIFIQTKQFVLFKFTEAFLISVTGKLDAPKFQLQRKKRFLGVL